MDDEINGAIAALKDINDKLRPYYFEHKGDRDHNNVARLLDQVREIMLRADSIYDDVKDSHAKTPPKDTGGKFIVPILKK